MVSNSLDKSPEIEVDELESQDTVQPVIDEASQSGGVHDTPVDEVSQETLSTIAFGEDGDRGVNALVADYRKAVEESTGPEDLSKRLEQIDRTLGERVSEEGEIAVARAEAVLDLADQLRGKQLTPENEALWIRLLDDVSPGPHADYLFDCLRDVDLSGSSVHTHLQQVRGDWAKNYAGNILYSEALGRLDAILDVSHKSEIVARLVGIFDKK